MEREKRIDIIKLPKVDIKGVKGAIPVERAWTLWKQWGSFGQNTDTKGLQNSLEWVTIRLQFENKLKQGEIE